jgi:LysM repeat protein
MMTRTPRRWRILLLSCATLLFGSSNVAPLHAQQRAGAHVRSAAAMSQSRRTRRSSARPQSHKQRSIKVQVRAGDTLESLAERFNITADEIATLNNLVFNAQLRPGQQIKVPLSSVEEAKDADETPLPAVENLRKSLSLIDGTTVEVDDVWEDAQGVWYKRGGITNLVERSRVKQIERGSVAEEAKTANGLAAAPKVKIVEVNATQTTTPPQPVWIYMVGGARVEADDVTETTEGAWYKRGNLSIFLERARIERIERERAPVVAGTDGKRRWTERGWSTGNARLDALIRQNGARYGVDPYLIFCVMEQESHFNARVVSPAGAQGLMQLMPGTGARFGVRRPFDPAENIMGGTRYLKMLLNNFGGRVDLVLAGYNAGEGAVMKYGGRVPPYRETRDYVKRISARYQRNRPTVTAASHAAAPPAATKPAAVAAAKGIK